MNSQRTARGKSRVQALYLPKTKLMETGQYSAVTLGCERRTVQRWLRQYREGGIEQLSNLKTSSGPLASIPDWGLEKLKLELQMREGFSSYKEIQKWLKAV